MLQESIAKGIGTNTILQDKNNQIVEAGIAGKADEGDDPRLRDIAMMLQVSRR